MKTQEAGEFQMVVFRAGLEMYALPVSDVREVRRFEPLTELPESPSSMAGVLHLRGKVLEVMDLRKKLGTGSVEPGAQTRIMIVRLADAWVGLLVDEVQSVAAFSKQALRELPAATQRPDDRRYVSALIHTPEHLILVLDTSALGGVFHV